MPKLKGVGVLNMMEVLGIVPGQSGGAVYMDRILALWGGGSCPSNLCHLQDPGEQDSRVSGDPAKGTR
jgi:hypothetical protein